MQIPKREKYWMFGAPSVHVGLIIILDALFLILGIGFGAVTNVPGEENGTYMLLMLLGFLPIVVASQMLLFTSFKGWARTRKAINYAAGVGLLLLAVGVLGIGFN